MSDMGPTPGDAPRVLARAVAIGGGTGLPTVLGCLGELADEVTAVVSVADDGGSSGRLRNELGMLPPGDLRKCLVALAEPDSALARLFEYRFRAGEGLEGHTLGNLMIAALTDLEGGFVEGVESAGRLLGARGRVLPSTVADVTLYARAGDGSTIAGQYDIATLPKEVREVYLEPGDAPAYPATERALRSAELIVIGPGSLYTSILPNLLVRGVPEAVRESTARKVLVMNLVNQPGETDGYDARGHYEALTLHAGRGLVDLVLLNDPGSFTPQGMDQLAERGLAPVACEDLRAEIGLPVVVRPMASAHDPARHDPDALCRAIAEIASSRELGAGAATGLAAGAGGEEAAG